MIKAVPASVALMLASPAFAIDLPMDALTKYSEFREAMLKRGWTPDKNFGHENEYGFPEVSCGNRMCIARWIGEGKVAVDLALWFDLTDLYLAPQVDTEDLDTNK